MDQADRPSNDHIFSAIEGTRYLTFRLADEPYGVEMVRVKDMTCHSRIVRLGGMPPILKGFVNLAGMMLPVIDLRQMSTGDSTGDGFNIVLAVHSADRVVGIVVDAIAEVLDIAIVRDPATASVASAVDRRYISGIGEVADRAIYLLDVDRLIDTVVELARVPA